MIDKRSWPRLAAALLAASLLTGCAGLMGGSGPVSTADAPAAATAISAYRLSRGLPPVSVDASLNRAAAAQASAMASRSLLSHSAGGDLRSRLMAAGVRDVPAVENVGRGHVSWDRAIASWQRSPGHDANLRNVDATRIGFARAEGPGGPWWALVMAGDPRPGMAWR
jgi:uncharacterized protein YkwD